MTKHSCCSEIRFIRQAGEHGYAALAQRSHWRPMHGPIRRPPREHRWEPRDVLILLSLGAFLGAFWAVVWCGLRAWL